ncbi:MULTISPECIES: helix-turn-helix domain-containing protein [unclassified Fictibacillus]|uniref:helix-turn-helix domain-containing protein n=1 Tax=unclassified Fictibacillus TaxID=2644029 RepID=UPI000781A553|nr:MULTISPECIES: RodZ domain-containing protein [unclassified Fictibacillus]MED2973256.1 helix-turn-helix domain-containing protein [Fictibacillus sp. B-59209]UZJ77105.1 helix-turn-helix domain-containing protein [Fictibacillus sp. KU28468]
MTELGNYLREKREEKGLSLEQLQTETKIQKRYLQAIEEGRYEILPGSFYARAFIKNYSETVGLNFEEVFTQFENEIPKAEKEPTEFVPRSERNKQTLDAKDSVLSSWLPKVLIFAFVLALLIGVWAYLANRGNDGADSKDSNKPASVQLDKSKKAENTNKAKDKKPEKPANSDSPKKPAEPKKKEFTLTKQATQGITTTYELSQADDFKIAFKMDGPVYLEVKTGSKTLAGKMFKKGDTASYDLSGEKDVELNIGAANFAKMTINEKPFSYPIPPVKRGIHQRIVIKNTASGKQ